MTTPRSIHEEILVFADKQPLWVRDALRRIATTGKPTRSDLDDAVAMCSEAHALPLVGPAPMPDPLAVTHLPSSHGDAASSITLTALYDLQNVNALLPRQRLELSPTGISVVYGENGAGKSGYARVLKQLCRARGNLAPILTNVFDKEAGAPSASIDFRIGGEARTRSGQLDASGASAPPELTEVWVYDVAAGAHTVEQKQEVTLLPPGLEVLPWLKDVLEYVAAELRRGAEADGAGSLPSPHVGTVAHRFMQGLSSATKASELDEACAWSADDESEREKATAKVAELRAADPKALAAKARKRAERLELLRAALAKGTTELGGEVEARVERALSELHDARAALSLQRGGSLPEHVLTGTGSGAWKALWEAARAYSEQEAYPGHAFPHVDQGARCVLCQQDLNEAASGRLRDFEVYVQGALSKREKAAEIALTALREGIERAIEPGLADGTSFDVLDDALGVDPATVKALVDAAISRRDALLARLRADEQRGPLPPLPAAPDAELESAASEARLQAQVLDASPAGQALQAALSALHELEDRKLLHVGRAALEAEVLRKGRADRRKAAQKECNTAAVSALLGKLTEKHVTDALAEAFDRELKELGGGGLSVKLEKAGTSKAATYTTLKLVDADHKHAIVPSVFSEGEQRAVSLAWFFAEVGRSPAKSAIVFDDPVSSMDHGWRRKVAKRLVAEAKGRQVVVFTHDVVFLHMLTTQAQAEDVACSGVHLQRHGRKPGLCSCDLPWDAKKVKDRVGALKNDYLDLRKARSGPDEEYTKLVVAYLDRLRKTWERAVEECLFNGVVRRFDYGVKTRNLKGVDVTSSDHDTIERGMSACSAWVHDQASPLQNPPPTPEAIAAMVNDLVAWVGALRERRKGQDLPKLTPIAP